MRIHHSNIISEDLPWQSPVRPAGEHEGFEFADCAIVNPTASECGRFSVSPAYYGFTVVDLNGHRTAWCKDLADGVRLFLIDARYRSHQLGETCQPFVLLRCPSVFDQLGERYAMQVGVVPDDD
jgi:hypothetical protein